VFGTIFSVPKSIWFCFMLHFYFDLSLALLNSQDLMDSVLRKRSVTSRWFSFLWFFVGFSFMKRSRKCQLYKITDHTKIHNNPSSHIKYLARPVPDRSWVPLQLLVPPTEFYISLIQFKFLKLISLQAAVWPTWFNEYAVLRFHLLQQDNPIKLKPSRSESSQVNRKDVNFNFLPCTHVDHVRLLPAVKLYIWFFRGFVWSIFTAKLTHDRYMNIAMSLKDIASKPDIYLTN